MDLSTGVYFDGTTSYVEKTGDLFLLVIVQSPYPELTTFQPPPKSHCVASNNMMYRHLSLVSQRSRIYWALTPSDEQASTATVLTPFTAVHTQSAVHAPPYRALIQQFLGDGYIFSVPAAGVNPLTYSIGATVIQHDCCPQHFQLKHKVIDLLPVYDIHLSEPLLWTTRSHSQAAQLLLTTQHSAPPSLSQRPSSLH